MASIGPNRFVKSFEAAATVSAFRVVGFDTATTAIDGHVRVIQWFSETAHILGVAQNYADTAAAGFQACGVVSLGYSTVKSGASVSAGSILMPVTTTGLAIESGLGATFATTAFSTVGSVVPKTLGIALEKASLSEASLECFLQIDNGRVRIA